MAHGLPEFPHPCNGFVETDLEAEASERYAEVTEPQARRWGSFLRCFSEALSCI
jgi:hypothetical protein